MGANTGREIITITEYLNMGYNKDEAEKVYDLQDSYTVLGFFVHKNDLKSELDGVTVMVVIDNNGRNLTAYSPIGQHHDMSREYFKECVRISKQQYLEASGRNGTPSDYLGEGR